MVERGVEVSGQDPHADAGRRRRKRAEVRAPLVHVGLADRHPWVHRGELDLRRSARAQPRGGHGLAGRDGASSQREPRMDGRPKAAPASVAHALGQQPVDPGPVELGCDLRGDLLEAHDVRPLAPDHLEMLRAARGCW